MVANADIDALAEIAVQARAHPDWPEFASFCDLRGRGLRADAFKQLNGFLNRTAEWPFDARLQFTRWLLDRWKNKFAIPQPLYARLVVPTVREWAEIDPHQSLAFLWLGLLGCDNPMAHVERALELNPELEVARSTMAGWILIEVNYNQHEMPCLYIHDPREDLKRLERAELLIRDGGGQGWIADVQKEIPDLRRRAEEWLAAHPRQGDFASR